MKYADGFVIVCPKKGLKQYKRMATLGKKVWMDHGALEYFECVGNDLKQKMGMGLPFPKLTKAKPNEVVIFSWILYKSKKHRDAVNKKVMKDPRLANMCQSPADMPFDMKRFSYGGFEVIVEG